MREGSEFPWQGSLPTTGALARNSYRTWSVQVRCVCYYMLVDMIIRQGGWPGKIELWWRDSWHRITVYLLSVHKKMREVLRRFSKHYNKIIEVAASTQQDYPIINICNILLPESIENNFRWLRQAFQVDGKQFIENLHHWEKSYNTTGATKY